MTNRFDVQAVKRVFSPVLPAAAVLVYYCVGAFGVGFGVGYTIFGP
ncbi:MAG: hypothetical protein ACOY94_23000 [Bacillota bacterium]